MDTETVDAPVVESGPPEDMGEYLKWHEAGGDNPTDKPAIAPGAKEEPSELPEETLEGQTAVESETPEEKQQVEDEPQVVQPGEPDKGLAKRMRKLTGEIAGLRAELEEARKPPEDGEEVTTEAASVTEPVVAEEPLVRPMLKDFEDTDTQSAWDQYEAAMETYHDAKSARSMQKVIDGHKAELAKQASETEFKVASEVAKANWSKAASAYPDFNEVMTDEVKVSQAMISVLKNPSVMDPEVGAALSYYLGKHPEESQKIAELTLSDAAHYPMALARAGMLLGELRAKLPAAPKPGTHATPPAAAPAAVAPKAAAAAPAAPPLKKVTTASRPPKQLGGAAAPVAFDLMDDEHAHDVGKWMKEREKQLALNGKR
jgi:hypothetical protein